MLRFVFGIFIGIIIGLFIYNRVFNQEVKNLKEQLNNAENFLVYNNKLRTSGLSRPLERLLIAINNLLDQLHNRYNLLYHKDQKLREDLSSISHDLRTPLTAILGFVQLLEDENISEAKRKEYIDIIKARINILQNMINDLFYLMRLEQDAIEFEYKEVDVTSLVAEQLASFYPRFVKEEFNLEVGMDESLNIVTDYQAISRIVANLLNNMLQHGAGYGKLSLKDRPNGIELTLSNNYEGEISDASLLVERHYMADTARRQDNTGLGLTIVDELCKQLDLELEITAEDNVYSCMVLIPRVVNLV